MGLDRAEYNHLATDKGSLFLCWEFIAYVQALLCITLWNNPKENRTAIQATDFTFVSIPSNSAMESLVKLGPRCCWTRKNRLPGVGVISHNCCLCSQPCRYPSFDTFKLIPHHPTLNPWLKHHDLKVSFGGISKIHCDVMLSF